MKNIFSFAVIALCLSCGGTQTPAQSRPSERIPIRNIVRPRALYELRCPTEQVQITEIAPNNFAARGCGSEAVYVCVGSMGNFACRRDGEVRGTAVASAGDAGAADGAVTAAVAPPAAPPAVPGRLLTDNRAPYGTIVRPRAANDLHCDAATVQIYEIASQTYVARGCNAEGLYVCTGAMGMYQCERN